MTPSKGEQPARSGTRDQGSRSRPCQDVSWWVALSGSPSIPTLSPSIKLQAHVRRGDLWRPVGARGGSPPTGKTAEQRVGCWRGTTWRLCFGGPGGCHKPRHQEGAADLGGTVGSRARACVLMPAREPEFAWTPGRARPQGGEQASSDVGGRERLLHAGRGLSGVPGGGGISSSTSPHAPTT